MLADQVTSQAEQGQTLVCQFSMPTLVYKLFSGFRFLFVRLGLCSRKALIVLISDQFVNESPPVVLRVPNLFDSPPKMFSPHSSIQNLLFAFILFVTYLASFP